MSRRLTGVVAFSLGFSVLVFAQTDGSTWMDRRPLPTWNRTAAMISDAPRGRETLEAMRARCQTVRPATPDHETIEDAGWLSYEHLDRVYVRDDVRVIAGMASANATCEPMVYQLFVFVAGTFAGTLSPQPMLTAEGDVAGAVRFPSANEISVEFARFRVGDSPCCPYARATARYEVRRAGQIASVLVVDVRETRRQP